MSILQAIVAVSSLGTAGPTSIISSGILFDLDMKNYVSGTGWPDASSNHNDFSFTNTPTVANTGTNTAYWDNTAGVYVNAQPTSDSAILPNGNYTKGVLLRTDDGNTGTGNILSSVNGIDVFWTNGGNIIQGGHNGDWSHVVGSTPIPVGQWVYVAVTFDTTTGWKLYQNGVLIGSNTDAANVMGADSIPNIAGFTGNYGWTGKYAAAHEYTRALSLAEIQQNYQYYLSRYS